MSDVQEYDIVIIGGGPGGYVAAIRAAQLGMKTACIEKRGALGGTCLNVGCIPSKALLNSSEIYESVNEHGSQHGIKGNIEINVADMLKNKDEVVDGLTKGIEGLFKKNKIDYLKGHGIIMGQGEVAVKYTDGTAPTSIKTKNIVIATGSEVMPLPGVVIDEDKIVSSTGALELKEVPKKLAVIGGGVIGLEMGTVWKRLGSEVTVIEFLDEIVPGADGEVRKQFRKILEKQGFKFKLGTKVTGVESSKKGVKISAEPSKGGDSEIIDADVVLVAIGRRPHTENLGLAEVGVNLDDRGRIAVDGHFKTNIDGIYAIGDVIEGPMLAHKAEEDGVACIEGIAGQAAHVDYNLVPGVIYTHPEVASVGKTEENLKESKVEYNVGKFPFMANSRARSTGETEGFVKILADKKTDEVLGVHIIGPTAGTMISEAVIAMEFKASSEDIARTCHPHPDFTEAVKEAGLDVAKRAIHK